MLTREDVVAGCDRYLATVATNDGAAVAALFAANGTLEDPVGSRPLRSDEISAFYATPRQITSIERIGPVTVSGRTGGFQFRIRLTLSADAFGLPAGSEVELTITEFLTFDDQRRIVSMVAAPDRLPEDSSLPDR